MTYEQFVAKVNERRARPTRTPKRKNKYHACKFHGYDSQKEYHRACELKLLERAGKISNLKEQVFFTLIPKQRNALGIMERDCKYKADFVYNDENGNTVVEDTKGYRTKEYIIKRKLMLMVHGITIIEI